MARIKYSNQGTTSRTASPVRYSLANKPVSLRRKPMIANYLNRMAGRMSNIGGWYEEPEGTGGGQVGVSNPIIAQPGPAQVPITTPVPIVYPDEGVGGGQVGEGEETIPSTPQEPNIPGGEVTGEVGQEQPEPGAGQNPYQPDVAAFQAQMLRRRLWLEAQRQRQVETANKRIAYLLSRQGISNIRTNKTWSGQGGGQPIGPDFWDIYTSKPAMRREMIVDRLLNRRIGTLPQEQPVQPNYYGGYYGGYGGYGGGGGGSYSGYNPYSWYFSLLNWRI